MMKYKNNKVDEFTIEITNFKRIEEEYECDYDEYLEEVFEENNITGFAYIECVDDELIRIRFEMDTNMKTLNHIIDFHNKIKILINAEMKLGIDYDEFIDNYNSKEVAFNDIDLNDFIFEDV